MSAAAPSPTGKRRLTGLTGFEDRLEAMALGEEFMIGSDWGSVAHNALRTWRYREGCHRGRPGVKEIEARRTVTGLLLRRIG